MRVAPKVVAVEVALPVPVSISWQLPSSPAAEWAGGLVDWWAGGLVEWIGGLLWIGGLVEWKLADRSSEGLQVKSSTRDRDGSADYYHWYHCAYYHHP